MNLSVLGLETLDFRCPVCDSCLPRERIRPRRRIACQNCSTAVTVPPVEQLLRECLSDAARSLDPASSAGREALAQVIARVIAGG